MDFTLQYRGNDLRSSGNARASLKEKLILRRCFHDQLKEVWRSHNVLSRIDPGRLPAPQRSAHNRWDLPRPLSAASSTDLEAFMFKHKAGGLSFVPLVTFPMEAHCYVDIRLGRPTRPGSIFFGKGDVDGRIKTLLDALRMPHNNHELPTGVPGDAYNYCLLADDDLVTRVSITSYRLLAGYNKDNYVDLDIDVTIKAVTPMVGTVALLY